MDLLKKQPRISHLYPRNRPATIDIHGKTKGVANEIVRHRNHRLESLDPKVDKFQNSGEKIHRGKSEKLAQVPVRRWDQFYPTREKEGEYTVMSTTQSKSSRSIRCD
jgi:hypothetical protein